MPNSTLGLELCMQALDALKGKLPDLLMQAAQAVGSAQAQALKEAAPVGKGGGGTAIPGDAPGPLAGSFEAQAEIQGSGAVVEVETDQPTKLKYVTEGTGIYGPLGQRIYPVTKKALYWPEADHPYRSVAGQKPNDFVCPIIEADPPVDEALQTLEDEVLATLEVI